MRILGLDFTSAVSGDKLNHLVEGSFDGAVLRCNTFRQLGRADALGELLKTDGAWVLGLDFPFGLPHEFVLAQNWPTGLGRVHEACCRHALRGLQGVHRTVSHRAAVRAEAAWKRG